jgi:4,5-dihydroxyphthalate decarboxylase
MTTAQPQTPRRYAEGTPTLKMLLGEYPKTQPIRDGKVAPTLSRLEIADIPIAQNGFKPLVRELAFDVAEIAIITYLQALDHGKPYALLPFVMNGNFHHGSVLVNVASGVSSPKDLEGRKVGMRSYTQTTPTWVRGYLAEDYGVDLSKVEWVTFEDAHLAEYKEPAGVTRAPKGAKIQDMLLDGELAAAFIAQGIADARVAPLIANPAAEAKAWYSKHNAVPINHMVTVRRELLEERPDIVREVFDVLVESRKSTGGSTVNDGVDLQPVGLSRLGAALEIVLRYAYDQKLVSRRFSVEELFTPDTATLGE